MKLVELIYQEAGNTKNINKFLFGDNYNLIDASKSLGRQIFKQILRLSLFPALKAKTDKNLMGGRLGATFSHKNETYRFVRDLEKDACSFSKYDGARKDFDEISRNASFIEKAFEETFKIDTRTYDKLFTFDEDFSKQWFLSHRNSSQGGYFEVLDGGGLREKAKKLKSLEEERKSIELMKSYEFDLDGLQSKLFEATDRIQKVKNKEDEISLILSELEHYKDFESLEGFPKDIEKRLKEHELQEEKKGADLVSLDNKMNDLVNKLASLKIEPVKKDKMFLTFVTGVLVCFGLAVFLKKFLIFSLIGFVLFMFLSAWRLILYIRKRDEEVNLDSQITSLTENKSVVEKRFEIETSIVKKFLETTKSESASDALDSMKRRLQIVQNLENAKKELEDLKSMLKYDDAQKNQGELKKQIKSTEERLRSFPSVSMEPNDLDREIEGLKSEIGDHALEPGVTGEGLDPYSFLINEAASVLKAETVKIAQALKESYTANLKILSDNYFSRAEWKGSSLAGFGITGQKDKNLGEMSEYEHGVAFCSFKFTILQMLARHMPKPVIAFGCFDSGNPAVGKERMMQALAHLAKSYQVIHVI